MASARVEIAIGELADKITILQIKSERLEDLRQLKNVAAELEVLTHAWSSHVHETEELSALVFELRQVNERLWNIEDDIRTHERSGEFGATFIELARSVYIQNDHRAHLKRAISKLTGSRLQEEKSYASYQPK